MSMKQIGSSMKPSRISSDGPAPGTGATQITTQHSSSPLVVISHDQLPAIKAFSQDPLDRDKASLVWLARSSACVVTEDFIPPWDDSLLFISKFLLDDGRHVNLYIRKDTDVVELDAMRKGIEMSMRTAPKNDILQAIIEMLALTKRKQTGEADTTITVGAYAERLAPYPRDAVMKVLRDWPDHSMWSPAWAELKCWLEMMCWRRKRALKALNLLIDEKNQVE